jgi:hypothetical protein
VLIPVLIDAQLLGDGGIVCCFTLSWLLVGGAAPHFDEAIW